MSYSPPRSTLGVWIVEDQARCREELVRLLDEVSDLRCAGVFPDCEAMLAALDALDGLDATDGLDGPDVALLDIRLKKGGADGIEGISQLKSRLPEVAIVMLTMHDSADYVFAALHAGASGYLVKPASVDTLISAIREAHRGGLPMPPPVARKVRRYFTGPGRDYGLSPREIEVLQWMEKGARQKEIAQALFLSHHTIDSHLRNIYQKLHVDSKVEAVAKAIRERLI